ncbi:MAG: family 20 glycosylhydrolase [Bacteroidetes bacterium]|jgi:hexosaminidase|nr:family 20 glycosylhydrolase [Bacteroidota bacterium]MBT6686386.1 family 20 glycosylhydrolase [Bacteroidota bacterium]MBT7142219.1 family 20 glycosylhydrolase [Bacteroidota bacterium]MBT7490426.1 family 20 glycosylhydrolase [Bacteroidota bacterium]
MKNITLTAISLIFILLSCKESKHHVGVLKAEIIPKPQSIVELGHNYIISKSTKIYVNETNDELKGVAKYLKKRIETSVQGASIAIVTNASSEEGIHLILNNEPDTLLGEEGYTLSSENNLLIKANTSAGIFYGVQTLLQLLPVEIYSKESKNFDLILPAVNIFDKPRYAYRGMHLDPCRHFFSVEFTKKYLDYMAYHKLNKFHWHLTEDQGWRIEIKKYPKLIEIGSKRKGTLILNHDVSWKEQKYDTIPVQGYYTQEQIFEIIQYAKERFIEVIPEIEMPGHATAALASYPNLSCTGGPFEVLQRPGVIADVYCAGNDSVFVFIKDIIDEVVELFPSKYIHIGGDECPKDRWKECSKCQNVIKREGLENEHELQSWFITEIEKYINSKGKTLIGWSEIMEGGIAPNAVLQSWLGTSAGIEAAKQKHNAIMSPYQYLYFDGIYVDKKHKKMEPFGQSYCWTNTEKVYSFDPTPDTIPQKYHSYFIGAEATMWTEFIKDESHLEYMLMPRISALSEICWTNKEQKDFADFSNRLDKQYMRYDQLETNYRIPHPIIPDTIFVDNSEKINIINPTGITNVRYTLDGSIPDENAKLYTGPFFITESKRLKARCFNQNGRGSSIATSIIIMKIPQNK